MPAFGYEAKKFNLKDKFRLYHFLEYPYNVSHDMLLNRYN